MLHLLTDAHHTLTSRTAIQQYRVNDSTYRDSSICVCWIMVNDNAAVPALWLVYAAATPPGLSYARMLQRLFWFLYAPTSNTRRVHNARRSCTVTQRFTCYTLALFALFKHHGA